VLISDLVYTLADDFLILEDYNCKLWETAGLSISAFTCIHKNDVKTNICNKVKDILSGRRSL
jgi:hypothetical protein